MSFKRSNNHQYLQPCFSRFATGGGGWLWQNA